MPKKPTRGFHVFIDTNILLNFYHYSKDDLDALKGVFASHVHGAATVHLTQQVCDEFQRNRENKIKDALRRFKEIKYSAQFPSFMKDYEEYSAIKDLSAELQNLLKAISGKAEADIINQQLPADQIIRNIFQRFKAVETSQKIYEAATMRVMIGNPPGKFGSLGDAINWIVLLQFVPLENDLHIISEDGDYYSVINEDTVHPFLKAEWKKEKKSSLFVYRTLTAFMKQHFDGVAFSFDKTKNALIEDLKTSRSFANSHQIIEFLDSYTYFAQDEIEKMLDAAIENKQFGQIVQDSDVSDFLNKVAVPKYADILNENRRRVLDLVIKEQSERQS